MKLIEIYAVVESGGVIRLPEAEKKAIGIEDGDEVCLSYITQSEAGRINESKEFIIETCESEE